MIVIDTNVVSEMMRPQQEDKVSTWLDAQQPSDLFLTATSVAEMLFGIERLPAGVRRNHLAEAYSRLAGHGFAGRVLPLDQYAAAHAARIAAGREAMGRPMSMTDAQIAGICLQHHAKLATRNTKDFGDCGLTLINPWTATGRA